MLMIPEKTKNAPCIIFKGYDVPIKCTKFVLCQKIASMKIPSLLLSVAVLFSCKQKTPGDVFITGNTILMSNDTTVTTKTETATIANGCFWCTEAIFQELNGVIKVTSGYSGGKIENPTYKQVCTGETGHAECLEIVYDPAKISFDELLEVFWKTHDPTTLNRQGADEIGRA